MRAKQIVIVVASLVALWLSLVIVKADPAEAVKTLFMGAFGSPSAISGTLRETTPLLFLGAAVYIALKAGLFNIGAEGQYTVGACFGAITMLNVPGPAGVVAGVLVGAITGALWACPAGLIKAYRNGHEVISSIMLNSIAYFLTKALVAGPFKGQGQLTPSTSPLPVQSKLTPLANIGGVEIPQSFILGILVIVGVSFWLSRTTSGYELKAAGANARAAEFAGVKTKQVTVKAMALSGGLAGVAGALQVAQFESRFYDGFSVGYGFDALGVALLTGGSPLTLLFSASFFGALNKGGTALAILGINKGITSVILAVVIIIFAVFRYAKKGEQHD